MPKGGKRPGAGRPKGARNKATEEARAMAEESGETPLAYMLRVMRDDTADEKRRDAMAQAAAPYIHAKLSSVEMQADVAHDYAKLSDGELNRQIVAALRQHGATPEMIAMMGYVVEDDAQGPS